MSDLDEGKGKCKPDMECLGGNAFLLLATGIFCLLPGSILMALYGNLPGYTAIRLGTYILFICGACFLLIGILLIIYWCQVSGYKSLPDKSDDTERGNRKADKGKVKEENTKSKDKEKPETSGEMLTGRSDPGRMELSEQWYTQKTTRVVDYSSPSPMSTADVSSSSSDNRYQYENPVLRHDLYNDED